MGEWLVRLAAGQGFLPHGYCFQWSPALLSTMVTSDATIVASYYSIPLALIAFVRARKDIRFNWVFWLFATFIFLCGTTHLLDVAMIWWPAYWLQGYSKAATAVVSAATSIALWRLMPKLLNLPSNQQLAELVSQLEREVGQRREAQERLDKMNEELEHRIDERTRELKEAIEERERLKDADRARELAEAKDRAKSEFLSKMSHELRTPLNAVLGFSQLLMLDGDDNKLTVVQRDWVQRVHAAGQHQLGLVEDLLDMARIEARGLEVRIEPVDLVSLAVECEAMVSEAARARDVCLKVKADSSSVLSDARRLRQILTNLLTNGIKYNRPGGRVEALLTLHGGCLVMSVADTGVGMTPQQQSELFTPFNRLGKEADLQYAGTGLGLSITKQLVEALGGKISVDSAPKQGSTFRVVLPMSATCS